MITKTRNHIAVDRYAFDWGMCSMARGWAQIDTEQDASYFGTWANPFERKLFSYVEGDVCLTLCDTDQEFVNEILRIKAWHDETGWKFLGIDPGVNHDNPLGAAFKRMGLGQWLH